MVRLSPYRTAGRRDIDGVVVTFVDVTATKQAEAALRASQARLAAELNVMRRLHEMTLDVATASNMRSALDRVLRTAIELHGADMGHVQLIAPDGRPGIAAHEGFEPDVLEQLQEVANDGTAYDRALRMRQSLQIEDVGRDAAGARDPVATHAGYRALQSVPLLDRQGRIIGVLSVHFRDVHPFTERDRQVGDVLGRVAADLIESRAQYEHVQQLNDVLRRRTAELEASQDQLARQAAELRVQDRHREEFLGALGHELRNPMAAIQSGLALISASDDRSHRALGVLRRQTQHMTRLINDLLDMTRVRHGQIRLECRPTDVGQAVAAAVESVRPSADAKHLRLLADVPAAPVIVHADGERLAQMLDNLLRNAITYTDAGTVTASAEADGDVARIVIADSGIGIDPADLPTLFEPYQRGGDGRRSEGLGLGLALVKALVEAHGGTLACHSDGAGTGSQFTITLPITPARVTVSAASTLAPPVRRRVLVVDDQRDVADMLAGVLESLGQDVITAYDAASALILARERRPHAAFLDLSMPEVGGAALARQLRKDFGPHALRLIAVTGHGRSAQGFEDGAFDRHLLKPVTAEQVAALLHELHPTAPPPGTPDEPSDAAG